MVFKFFREMIDAAKEGVAEAKAEAAEEAAERERQAGLEAPLVDDRLNELDPEEFFATALGAPYRRVFIGESLSDLVSLEIPSAKRDELAKLIARDFDVSDRESLEAMFAMVPLSPGESLNEEAKAELALWSSRLSYATAVCAGLGYISQEEALKLLQPLSALVRPQFADWKDFGRHFVIGDKIDGSNNFLGRKVLASFIGKLNEDAGSPWVLREFG